MANKEVSYQVQALCIVVQSVPSSVGRTAGSSASAPAQLWVKECTIFMLAKNIPSSIIISGDLIKWSLLLTEAVMQFTTVVYYTTVQKD